jgi:hypothetical protein
MDKLSRPTFTSVVYDPMRGTLTGYAEPNRRVTIALSSDEKHLLTRRRRECDLDTMAMLLDEREPREEEPEESGVRERPGALTYEQAAGGLEATRKLEALFKARCAS